MKRHSDCLRVALYAAKARKPFKVYSLLFVGGRKKCYLLDNPSRNRTTLEFGVGKMDPYQNNLKGAWNEWQSH